MQCTVGMRKEEECNVSGEGICTVHGAIVFCRRHVSHNGASWGHWRAGEFSRCDFPHRRRATRDIVWNDGAIEKPLPVAVTDNDICSMCGCSLGQEPHASECPERSEG